MWGRASERVRSGVRAWRRIRLAGSVLIQPWVRHHPAAERIASSRAFAVAGAELPQRRANQVPIWSAVSSSSDARAPARIADRRQVVAPDLPALGDLADGRPLHAG
jgi:hypothetical protein